ncbi:unnamed protein product [Adineta ricciae]|uniref:Uncharacterized protein n=1 Tax=Adineta ricciae TaxID=249248 RepID=A0A813X9I6_ADIRI|nr:unnamed protein product [Adineta ricciae]CAF0906036.1 unnamed protein product [Adineta ricciae]
MVSMAGQQHQYSPRYPSLLVTLKHKPEERTHADVYSTARARRAKDSYYPSLFQTKNVYMNGNQRQQPPSPPVQSSPPQQQLPHRSHVPPRYQQKPTFYNNSDRIHQPYQQQSIRPLMEIKDNLFSLHDDVEPDLDDDDQSLRILQPKDAQQRTQYRNRKAELDWDHAFDLDLIDLYSTHIDTDSHSLTSTISSTDTSYCSF